jgi:hypothetical protein
MGAAQFLRQGLRLFSAGLIKWNIRLPLKETIQIPISLSVTYQPDLGHATAMPS